MTRWTGVLQSTGGWRIIDLSELMDCDARVCGGKPVYGRHMLGAG